jgi:antitoxin YefM
MLDLAVKSGTFRQNFSEYFDAVVRTGPKVVNRHRDHIMMLNLDHVAAIVGDFKLHATVEQDETGEYIASSVEIEDMFATGDTVEEALLSLSNDLIEYSHDYLSDSFTLYFNAPNRRRHFPYVMKVMMQNSPEDVLRLIDAEYQGS